MWSSICPRRAFVVGSAHARSRATAPRRRHSVLSPGRYCVAPASEQTQLRDPADTEHHRQDRGADSGDQQRQGQRQGAVHPQESDLDAAGVLQHEHDQGDRASAAAQIPSPGRTPPSPRYRIRPGRWAPRTPQRVPAPRPRPLWSQPGPRALWIHQNRLVRRTASTTPILPPATSHAGRRDRHCLMDLAYAVSPGAVSVDFTDHRTCLIVPVVVVTSGPQ